MKESFHRCLGNPQRSCKFPVRDIFTLGSQTIGERIKHPAASSTFTFFFESSQSMFDCGGGPPCIIELFRRPAFRLPGGNRQIGRCFRHPLVPGYKLQVASALKSAFLYRVVDKEILQCFEQQRAESATIWVCALEQPAFKHHNKEALGQILCIWNRAAMLADESEDGAPISAA